MRLMICFSLLVVALAMSWVYLWPKRSGGAARQERPWRRVGAGISLVLAVMFTSGIYVLGDDPSPTVYAWYWSVIMLLVVWLVLLGVRDMAYTRREITRRRRAHRLARDGEVQGGS